MKKMRGKFLKLHLYISLFFLPMAMFYKITGGIAIFQYFGNQESKQIDFTQSQMDFFQSFRMDSNPSSKEELQEARTKILEFLALNHIEIPYTTAIKDSWDNKRFVVGGAAQYVEIEKNTPQNLIIYKRDFFSNLITLHFARGGILFNILAFSFVVFMFITYVTGLLLCNFSKHKKKYGLCVAIGFIVTIFAGFISII